MVECFWPGVSAAAVAEATSRLDEASEALTGAGVVARRTVATYVPAEETVMWLFEADGEASLRALAREGRGALRPGPPGRDEHRGRRCSRR